MARAIITTCKKNDREQGTLFEDGSANFGNHLR